MAVYFLGRLILHALVLIFAICELGVSANLVHLASPYHLTLDYFNLALAVSVITLVLLPAVIVLDRLRANFLLSWTAVELGWNGVLWVLWLAAAADSTSKLQGLDCSSRSLVILYLEYYGASDAQTVCQQAQAVQAFAWLNWIFLFVLFWWLLIMGIVYHSESNGAIWTCSAADYQGSSAVESKAVGGEMPMTQQPTMAGTPATVAHGAPTPAGQV